MAGPRCRLCGAELNHTFVDLGMSPPCESYLRADEIDQGETFYPLHVRVCHECLLVQLPAYVPAEDIFSDYAYFSSYSDSWVRHAETFVDGACERLGLGSESFVVEVASNDGYLLQHASPGGSAPWGSSRQRTSPPPPSTRASRPRSSSSARTTGTTFATAHGRADLVAANNVFAHVPDIVDFSKGLRALVADDGLRRASRSRTSCGSSRATSTTRSTTSTTPTSRSSPPSGPRGCRAHRRRRRGAEHPRGLAADVVDARRACARADRPPSPRCSPTRPPPACTRSTGMTGSPRRSPRSAATSWSSSSTARRRARGSPGYGAPGKGNTLLNHCGIRSDLIAFTVDRNPFKHGMFLPGTHIPVHPVEAGSR